MTIATTQTFIQYLGDGTTTAFPVPFPFFGTDELVVTRRVISTGVETVLVLGVNYTVTGGNGGTGTVTATTAPAAGNQWTIERATEVLQEIDFQSNGAFPEDAVERGLDRVTAILQEVDSATNRSLRVPVSDPLTGLVLPGSVARANTVLAFDASGVPYVREINEAGILAGPTGATGATGVSWEPGSVRWWPGATIPLGWAVCNGALYSTTVFPLLYAAIGRAWTGGGDPADQFRVPDLRGRGVIGLDNMGGTAANRVTVGVSGILGSTLGGTGGSQLLHAHNHALTDPVHTHSVSVALTSDGAHNHFGAISGVFHGEGSGGFSYDGGATAFQQTGAEGNGAHSHTAVAYNTPANSGVTIASAGTGGSQNMPPVAVGNWIIKLDGALPGAGAVVTGLTIDARNYVTMGAASDQSAGLQSAINAAAAAATGSYGGVAQVDLPGGLLRLDNSVTLPSFVSLIGRGPQHTYIDLYSAATINLGTASPAAATRCQVVAGMTIGTANKTDPTTYAIAVRNTYLANVRDVTIEGAVLGILVGERTNSTRIENTVIVVNTGTSPIGIHWRGGATSADRSDILYLRNVGITGQWSNATLVLWEGFANTMDVESLRLMQAKRHFHVRLGPGGASAFPAFLNAFNIQAEGAKDW